MSEGLLVIGAVLNLSPTKRVKTPVLMNSLSRTGGTLLCALTFCSLAAAQVRSHPINPYQSIPARNAFALRPAPSPAPTQPTVACPDIVLTGLTTITGRKLALLKLDFPAKPSQRQREESCILTEGDKDGPVRVLQIDMKTETVKVDNSGKVALLTFQKNGPKTTPASPINRSSPWTIRRR
jgi:hypothetical protein